MRRDRDEIARARTGGRLSLVRGPSKTHSGPGGRPSICCSCRFRRKYPPTMYCGSFFLPARLFSPPLPSPHLSSFYFLPRGARNGPSTKLSPSSRGRRRKGDASAHEGEREERRTRSAFPNPIPVGTTSKIAASLPLPRRIALLDSRPPRGGLSRFHLPTRKEEKKRFSSSSSSSSIKHVSLREIEVEDWKNRRNVRLVVTRRDSFLLSSWIVNRWGWDKCQLSFREDTKRSHERNMEEGESPASLRSELLKVGWHQREILTRVKRWNAFACSIRNQARCNSCAAAFIFLALVPFRIRVNYKTMGFRDRRGNALRLRNSRKSIYLSHCRLIDT